MDKADSKALVKSIEDLNLRLLEQTKVFNESFRKFAEYLHVPLEGDVVSPKTAFCPVEVDWIEPSLKAEACMTTTPNGIVTIEIAFKPEDAQTIWDLYFSMNVQKLTLSVMEPDSEEN